MVVRETRIIFEPSDIKAVILKCSCCGAEVRLRQDTVTFGEKVIEDLMPEVCPSCCVKWKQSPLEISEAVQLLRCLRRLRALEAYSVCLETFGDVKESQSSR